MKKREIVCGILASILMVFGIIVFLFEKNYLLSNSLFLLSMLNWLIFSI